MGSNIAIFVAVGVAAVIFVVVFAIVWLLRRKWKYVSFTPHKCVEDLKTETFKLTEEVHPFEPRLAHYLKTSEVVITLASASLVFIPRLSISTHPEWFAFSMTLFGLCVLFLVLFMVLLIFFYEDSLYFPTHYTVRKSALVLALGFTGLFSFVLAYLSIAVQVAKAVGDKVMVLR